MQAHRNSIATKREQKKGMVEGLDELLKTIPTPSKKNKVAFNYSCGWNNQMFVAGSGSGGLGCYAQGCP